MSRVTVTPIDVGDDVTISKPNTMLASWDVATAVIDGENIRLGGIHQRNIAADTASETPTGTDVFENVGPTTNSNAAWAVAVCGANIEIGDLTYNSSNEEMIIYCSFEYEGEASDNTGAGDPQYIFEFRLQYADDGVPTWNTIARSTRRESNGNELIIMHGSMDIVARVTESVNSSNFRVRLQQQETNGANVILTNCALFPRVVKL